jgi:hypothetical protein
MIPLRAAACGRPTREMRHSLYREADGAGDHRQVEAVGEAAGELSPPSSVPAAAALPRPLRSPAPYRPRAAEIGECRDFRWNVQEVAEDMHQVADNIRWVAGMRVRSGRRLPNFDHFEQIIDRNEDASVGCRAVLRPDLRHKIAIASPSLAGAKRIRGRIERTGMPARPGLRSRYCETSPLAMFRARRIFRSTPINLPHSLARNAILSSAGDHFIELSLGCPTSF